MFQATLNLNFKRMRNFMNFARAFFIRKNPFKAFIQSMADGLKEFLTMKKKLKMSQYRVNYHRHQLQKMEALIAENNQHTFLKGKNLNETR